MKNQVSTFFSELESNQDLMFQVREQLEKQGDSIENLVQLAKTHGFNFTAEDYEKFAQDLSSDSDISDISELSVPTIQDWVKGCDSGTASSCGCGNPSGSGSSPTR